MESESNPNERCVARPSLYMMEGSPEESPTQWLISDDAGNFSCMDEKFDSEGKPVFNPKGSIG